MTTLLRLSSVYCQHLMFNCVGVGKIKSDTLNFIYIHKKLLERCAFPGKVVSENMTSFMMKFEAIVSMLNEVNTSCPLRRSGPMPIS